MHTALDTIWASLPIPAILVDEGDKIAEINPAAEGFFNTSNRAINAVPLFDRLMVDAPLEAAYHRAREHSTPLFVNDVDVGTGDRAPSQCNLKFAPVLEHPGFMILLLAPRELAGWMSQTQTVKSAAKSAIGMAEMLAHEIKNPLAGITGAAQLLSMGLEPKDLELTDLIVEETRRIVKL
ncbi:MAG: PAS domain-containing sensor histidine kinase, partial [Rhodobacteraceae bacterium]|nr:PAS domain-containing sensor histidine kinase [Paracoccaceae bacterium]